MRARRLRIPITTVKLSWVQMSPPASGAPLRALRALLALLLLWVRSWLELLGV